MAITPGYTAASGDTITPTRLNNLAITGATMATAKILGRTTAGTGVIEEVATVGSGTNVPLVPGNGQYPFPATQNASADANTLDDYEEGTWTPRLSGATTTTYTLQTGTYTKIGRLVVAHCRLAINSVGDGSKTLIAGLPFSASAQQAGSVSYFSGAATSLVWATAYTNGSTIQIGTMASASTATGTADFFASGTDVMLTVVYHV